MAQISQKLVSSDIRRESKSTKKKQAYTFFCLWFDVESPCVFCKSTPIKLFYLLACPFDRLFLLQNPTLCFSKASFTEVLSYSFN
jgi:hypothetical protein